MNLNDLESFENQSAFEHKKSVADAGGDNGSARAVAQVSMTKRQKETLTRVAREHGLSLSSLFRLASEEYIANHGWKIPEDI